MHPAIRLAGLRMAYGDDVVLSDVDLQLAPGTTTVLVGPNGSGKSTLLGAIAGLTPTAGGTVEVLGRSPAAARADIAFVLQETPSSRLLPITVAEVVRLGRYGRRGAFGRMRPDDHAAVERAMVRMDVADLADRQLRELSGGQRQRVLVAQGLAQEADVLLLDEPVTGLDLVSQQAITTAVDAERAAGRTVVLSTHDLREAAHADVVVLLSGRVVASGSAEEVLTTAHLRAAYGHRLLDLGDGVGIEEHVHHHHTHHEDGRLHDHAPEPS